MIFYIELFISIKMDLAIITYYSWCAIKLNQILYSFWASFLLSIFVINCFISIITKHPTVLLCIIIIIIIIIIVIIIIIHFPFKSFFSCQRYLEFEWQVSLSLQDSSEYSEWS